MYSSSPFHYKIVKKGPSDNPSPSFPNPQLKGEEKEQADLDRKAHARMLHAVTFCGCLYNVGILTEKIIHSCIEALIKV